MFTTKESSLYEDHTKSVHTNEIRRTMKQHRSVSQYTIELTSGHRRATLTRYETRKILHCAENTADYLSSEPLGLVSPGCPPSSRVKVPTRSMLSGAAASCARRLAYLSSPSSAHLVRVRVRAWARASPHPNPSPLTLALALSP